MTNDTHDTINVKKLFSVLCHTYFIYIKYIPSMIIVHTMMVMIICVEIQLINRIIVKLWFFFKFICVILFYFLTFQLGLWTTLSIHQYLFITEKSSKRMVKINKITIKAIEECCLRDDCVFVWCDQPWTFYRNFIENHQWCMYLPQSHLLLSFFFF